MIGDATEFEPTVIPTVTDLEQDLLFIGTHSTTATFRVLLVQDGEQASFEIQNTALRHQMLNLLIDGVGNALERARKEEEQA